MIIAVIATHIFLYVDDLILVAELLLDQELTGWN